MTSVSRRDALRALAASTGAAAMAACGAPAPNRHESSAGPSPIAAARPAPEIPAADVPATTVGKPLWQAPFNDVPRRSGDMLIGPVFPDPEHGKLRIIGVDRRGETLWSVSTNPSCVGYGTSHTGTTHITIVLHSDADNRHGKIATRTTASAYDVRTGRRVWGPVRVPGPLRGPGLIFGATIGSVVGAPEGPKTLLAARDGTVVAWSGDGATPLYEHHGAALVRRDGELRAVDTAGGRTLWTGSDLPKPAGLRRVDFFGHEPASDGDTVALRWGDPDAPLVTLHELRTGRRLAMFPAADELRTIEEPASGAVVATDVGAAGKTVATERGSGRRLWERRTADTMRLSIAGGGIGYGSSDGTSAAVDLRSGRALDRGPWQVPVALTGKVLLTALPRHDGARPRFVAFRRTHR